MSSLRPGMPRLHLLIRNLWSCFADSAADELEGLKSDDALGPSDLKDAAWALSSFYAAKYADEQALQNLDLTRKLWGETEEPEEIVLLEIELLLRSGQIEKAKAALREGLNVWGETTDLCLSAANVAHFCREKDGLERDLVRLEWINKCLSRQGFAPLQLKDCSLPLAFDNITTSSVPRSMESDVKLSVVVPVHNAEDTIASALESLSSQTWSNLEILVVDDASTDQTWTAVQAAASRDERIVVLRHDENRGAYTARNTGLKRSSGHFVTVHDADDWSHPQKFAAQINELVERGSKLNTVFCARVDRRLRFLRPQRRSGGVLIESYPSLTFARQDGITLGGWDEVRMAADTEMYSRLLSYHKTKKSRVLPGVPLEFHLVSSGSLTAHKFTGAASLAYGSRREYKESFRYWHSLRQSNHDLHIRQDPRSFPAPAICRNFAGTQTYDVIIVSDFSLGGDTAISNVAMVNKAAEHELKIGCFHWPFFDSALAAFDPALRSLLHSRVADSVVAGEEVECDLVLVTEPRVLVSTPNALPQIRSKKCMLLWESIAEAREFRPLIPAAQQAFGAKPEIVVGFRHEMILSGAFVAAALAALKKSASSALSLFELRDSGLHS